MSKREAFKRLSSQRIEKLEKQIELVGNLSNRKNYQYTDNDAEQIIQKIDRAIDELRSKFKIEGKTSSPEIRIQSSGDIDRDAMSWILWARDKIINGMRTEALEMLNKGIQIQKDKQEEKA